MRKLNLTIQIEDNDLIEHKLRYYLEDRLGDAIISIKTLPNTEHLKDNTSFKELVKSKRNAQLQLDRFINNNRE